MGAEVITAFTVRTTSYRVLSERHHLPRGQENNSVVVTTSYLRGGAW